MNIPKRASLHHASRCATFSAGSSLIRVCWALLSPVSTGAAAGGGRTQATEKAGEAARMASRRIFEVGRDRIEDRGVKATPASDIWLSLPAAPSRRAADFIETLEHALNRFNLCAC